MGNDAFNLKIVDALGSAMINLDETHSSKLEKLENNIKSTFISKYQICEYIAD